MELGADVDVGYIEFPEILDEAYNYKSKHANYHDTMYEGICRRSLIIFISSQSTSWLSFLLLLCLKLFCFFQSDNNKYGPWYTDGNFEEPVITTASMSVP